MEQPMPCGAQHPNHPNLTCIRMGGSCPMDWHMGIILHADGRREVVEWGLTAEWYAQVHDWQGYRIMPITGAQP